MFPNAQNLCIFEGRIVNDPKFETIQSQNGPFEKASFTIAVDKNLTSQQRQAAKNDPSIQTADFVNFKLTGSKVDHLKQYCPKGRALTVVASYETWTSTNPNTGEKVYGHVFNVVDYKWTIKDASYLNNGNAANAQQPTQMQNQGQGGFQQQNFNAPPQNNPSMNNFNMFDSPESPFS